MASDAATGPAKAGSKDENFERLKRDGYCVIENALTDAQLAAAKERFTTQARAERSLTVGQNHANKASGNQWLGMLLNKGEIFFDLISHPIGTGLIEQLLGVDYTISAFDGHIQHVGSEAMAPHIDQWWLPAPVLPGTPALPAADVRRGSSVRREDADVGESRPAETPINNAVAASIMFMLTDFTADNGATCVVPGSHLSGAQPDPTTPTRYDMTTITGRAGSAFVFDGRLWHAAGSNQSTRPRMGVLAYYCAPFCRPLENYLSGMHPDARASCPPHILARLGYQSWQMYGHTGDLTGTDVGSPDRVLGELVDPSQP